MLIDWDSVEVVEMAPGVRQRQVELDGLFVALQEFEGAGLGGEMNPHAHPHEQAGYVLEGELEVLVGEEVHVIKAGEAYVVPPDAEHGGRAHVPVRLFNFYVAPGSDHIDEYRAKNSPGGEKSS
jgi:mannose-6-phosphate isomerase-like protein (cupin superfamily)